MYHVLYAVGCGPMASSTRAAMLFDYRALGVARTLCAVFPAPAGIKDATNDGKSLPRTNSRLRHCLHRYEMQAIVASVRGRSHRRANDSFVSI